MNPLFSRIKKTVPTSSSGILMIILVLVLTFFVAFSPSGFLVSGAKVAYNLPTAVEAKTGNNAQILSTMLNDDSTLQSDWILSTSSKGYGRSPMTVTFPMPVNYVDNLLLKLDAQFEKPNDATLEISCKGLNTRNRMANFPLKSETGESLKSWKPLNNGEFLLTIPTECANTAATAGTITITLEGNRNSKSKFDYMWLGYIISICGNGKIEGDEFCDDGADNGQPNKCNTICSAITDPVCGNAVKEEGESCDDGNLDENDWCSATCKFTYCGDGYIQMPNGEGNGETCDDGADNGKPNKCAADCSGITAGVCGNKELEKGEECDDGNKLDTDACTALCALTSCGDGIVQALNGNDVQEACDDGIEFNGLPNKCDDKCSGTTLSVCGNGIVEQDEVCDDKEENGNPLKCAADCSGTTAAVCGNSIEEAGETCDDGVDNGQPLKCAADCSGTTAAVCGNGVKEGAEACDDGAANGQAGKCKADCSGVAAPAATCTDSDNGRWVVKTKGTCDSNLNATPFTDECSNGLVKEYYCGDDKACYYDYTGCGSTDQYCSDGACLIGTCTDSDNGLVTNFTIIGYVYGYNASNGGQFYNVSDFCFNSTHLDEFYCKNSVNSTVALVNCLSIGKTCKAYANGARCE